MNPISSPTTSASAAGAPGRPADSPEEAARQFEAVLVRQFVEVMTKDLFDGGSEGGMTGQADLQRDTLTDTLTDHLVESGTFGVADLMIAQWKRAGRIPDNAPASAPTASGLRRAPDAPPTGAASGPPDPPVTGAASRAPESKVPRPNASGPVTMDEALRRYPLTKSTRTTQGPPVSYDHP